MHRKTYMVQMFIVPILIKTAIHFRMLIFCDYKLQNIIQKHSNATEVFPHIELLQILFKNNRINLFIN